MLILNAVNIALSTVAGEEKDRLATRVREQRGAAHLAEIDLLLSREIIKLNSN